jgi:hypothetical protein
MSNFFNESHSHEIRGNQDNSRKCNNGIDNFKDLATTLVNGISKETKYRSKGWYPKSSYIKKFMNQKTHKSRCISCYKFYGYENIEYARIINNYDNITEINLNKLGRTYSLCVNCCNNIDEMMCSNIKAAPRTYGDVINNYILSYKYELIAEDFTTIGMSGIDIINERINYMKFNFNEKMIIYNNLKNKNEILSKNLDLEVEKFNFLNQQKLINDDILTNIKNDLTNITNSLTNFISTNNNNIDTQIEKYNELNKITKYSIPECKICMSKEVKIVIQCGHLLCKECFNIIINNNNKDDLNNTVYFNENDIQENIICPICRAMSHTYTQIYF